MKKFIYIILAVALVACAPKQPARSLSEYAAEAREYISKAFEEGRYEEVEGMTKPMVCYSLIEV